VTVVAALLASAASAPEALAEGLLVPAYFYPGTGGSQGFTDGWAQMAASAGKVPITAIFNPNSGPLPGPPDPNYVNAITNLENAGGRVIAYIPTGNGSTPLSTIQADVQLYKSQYGNLIEGFFLDQLNVVPTTLSYYQSVYNYIKGVSPSYTVVGNQGSPFLNGLTPQQFLSTVDVMNIFEGPDTGPPGGVGFNNYPYGLNWFLNYPSDRFSNIVFSVPTAAEMLADLRKAEQLNAGSVFITDQGLPNPYSQLPSYWNQEVAALAVPEPGVPVYLLSAALCWSVVGLGRGRGRLRGVVGPTA
jgi:hypothetical protein